MYNFKMGSLKRIITVSAKKHKPYFSEDTKPARPPCAMQAVYSSQLFPVA